MIKKIIPIIVAVFLLNACEEKKTGSNEKSELKKEIPNIEFDYIGSYPHDTNSFTEGFLVHDGRLYESTGATKELPKTRSLFGTVDIGTGKINVKVEIDKEKYFGEGITFLNDRVFQLTYKSKVGFIYDAKSFKKIAEFTFPSKEGWGLTTDGEFLIMSDGTDVLTYLEPDKLNVVKKVAVTENGFVRDYLNELEYIKGFIYANVWTTNTIVKIDPANGKVVGKLDLSKYANDANNLHYQCLEMNGIAYDSIRDRAYVTGKMWPKIYEIKIKH